MICHCKLKSYFCEKVSIYCKNINMKRILVALAFIIFLNSCDDGKLTIDSVSFENKLVQKCADKNILYNINNNEVLLLQIPSIDAQFLNDTRISEIVIDASHQVRYRRFNGLIDLHNVCDTFFPITPTVSEEWLATSGILKIVSTAIYSDANATTGQQKIAAFNHQIILKNITFIKPSGPQIYPGEDFKFGIYQTIPTTLPLDFQNDLNFDACSSSQKIYKTSNSRFESLVLDNVNADLIKNEVGTVTQAIGTASNKLQYFLYQSAVPTPISDYFCATSTPLSPNTNETWFGVNGSVSEGTGMIEVVTTAIPTGGFKHQINLLKVTFNKEANHFYYGNTIPYGVLYN